MITQRHSLAPDSYYSTFNCYDQHNLTKTIVFCIVLNFCYFLIFLLVFSVSGCLNKNILFVLLSLLLNSTSWYKVFKLSGILRFDKNDVKRKLCIQFFICFSSSNLQKIRLFFFLDPYYYHHHYNLLYITINIIWLFHYLYMCVYQISL